jgi:hypothetical protein
MKKSKTNIDEMRKTVCFLIRIRSSYLWIDELLIIEPSFIYFIKIITAF